MQCAPSCPATCLSPFVFCDSIVCNVPGMCACPYGQVIDEVNNRCVPRDECPSATGIHFIKIYCKFLTIKLLLATASPEPGTVDSETEEPEKKTKDKESDDKEKNKSTPDPEPDNEKKTKPVSGELYCGHVDVTCSVYISCNNIVTVYCVTTKKTINQDLMMVN